jgi:HPt (histidine-containing phosphotransfer) domain-containing protein
VSAYVDPTRIRQLKEFLGAEAEPMIAPMLSSLADAIERLESVVESGEVDAAAQVAHTARNDALMLGAGPLQEALRELEAAARDADEAATGLLLERVREVWPATWEQLQEL